MGGWCVYGLLLVWAAIAQITQPSHAEFERACVGHGRVVSVAYDGFFTFGESVAVCSNGQIIKVD